MTIDIINATRKKIFGNKSDYDNISKFMMLYSFLEAYWTDSEDINNMNSFCKAYSDFYWKIDELRKLSEYYISTECIGSSNINRKRNIQDEKTAQATMYLRGNLLSSISFNCVESCRYDKRTACYKLSEKEYSKQKSPKMNKKELALYKDHDVYGKKLCSTLSSDIWKGQFEHISKEYASFRALMEIIRRIRNNLFHGNKFDVTNENQYVRNINLIINSSKIIELILDELDISNINNIKLNG